MESELKIFPPPPTSLKKRERELWIQLGQKAFSRCQLSNRHIPVFHAMIECTYQYEQIARFVSEQLNSPFGRMLPETEMQYREWLELNENLISLYNSFHLEFAPIELDLHSKIE